MFKRKQPLSFIMVFFLLFSLIIPANNVKAADASVQVTKTVSSTNITPTDELEVKLNINGTSPINVVQPNDVILIIDKSGSMLNDNRITSAKDAAKGFVDLMDLTKHTVGVVDFSTAATTFPLTTNGESVKSYINTIQANGSTETGVAIRTAITALSNHRSEAQPVIVILTDGAANSFPDAKLAAQEAKDAGIVFYTVALLASTDDPATNAPNLLLKDMATTAQHHHFVLGSTGLQEVYAAIVKEIGITSAKDVVVTDVVSPEFEIVPGSADQNIPKPTISGNTLTWNFIELKSETLTFTYKVRPKSQDVTGVFPISSGSTIEYKNYLGTTENLSIPNSDITIKFPKPDITSVTPDKSEVTGGTEITIQGTNFRQGAIVTLNSIAATNVQVNTENEIKATVPAGTQGNAVIRVQNLDGQYDEQAHYYSANPLVTAITPSKGFIDGGTKVTISGKYFLPGVKVFFNNIETTATYTNSQSLIATTPQSSFIGAVDVKVVNTDGTEVVALNAFTYERRPAPTITSLSQNSGMLVGGDLVIINGTGFQPGLKLTIGGVEANINIIYGETKFRVIIPVGANLGAKDVIVTNPDGQSGILTAGYTYLKIPEPSVTSITPNSGLLDGGNIVSITGSNFQQGATVSIGGVNGENVTFTDSTKISLKIPKSTKVGAVDVIVTNPDGQTTTLISGYTYNEPPKPAAPIITSISQNNGVLTGGDLVIINGTGFQSGLKLTIGGIQANINAFYGETKFRIIIPMGANPGAKDMVVTNPDGQSFTLTGGYTYNEPPKLPAPTITSISPTTGLIKGGELVYINGTDFQTGLKVFIGGIETNISYFYGATRFRIIMPATTSGGQVDVQVVNPDGQSATLLGAYTYTEPPKLPAPTITSLSPNNGLIKGGELVYVNGTNFQPGLKVIIGGIQTNIANFYSETSFRIFMPAAASEGLVDVQVVNPDGQSATLMGGYTYNLPPKLPAPTITSLSPKSGLIKGGELVVVNGTNFQSGLTITIGGKQASIANFYGATSIRIVMPATTIEGPVDVEVVNPDGQKATSNAAYTYVVPQLAITSLSITSGDILGNYIVSIYGQNFEDKVAVTVDGVPVNVTFMSSGYIRIISMPAGKAPGVVPIVVTNPSTGKTASINFTYNPKPALPICVLTSLKYTSGSIAGGQYMYIYGENFTPNMKLMIDGKQVPLMNFYSSTYIRAMSPAHAAGIVDIMIINEEGKASNVLKYEYK